MEALLVSAAIALAIEAEGMGEAVGDLVDDLAYRHAVDAAREARR